MVESQARAGGVQDAAACGCRGRGDQRRFRRHLGAADHPRIGHALLPRTERVYGRFERPSAPHRIGLQPAPLRRAAGADLGLRRSRAARGLRHRREDALRGAGRAGADPAGRLGEQCRDRDPDPHRAVAGRGAGGRRADRLERSRRARPAGEGRGTRRARVRRSGQLYPQQRRCRPGTTSWSTAARSTRCCTPSSKRSFPPMSACSASPTRPRSSATRCTRSCATCSWPWPSSSS